MQTRRLINAVSWKHAVGEVLLIVVGITIALGMDSGWEAQKARQEETVLLVQILVTLQEDLVNVQNDFALTSNRVRVHSELQQHIEEKRPESNSLDTGFRMMRQWQTTRVNPGSYDDLKARGLDLISNRQLRSQLIDYYDRARPWLEDRNRIDREAIMLFVEPYFVDRFRETSTDFAPVDYQQLIADNRFVSILAHRIGKYEELTLPTYERMLSFSVELIAALEAELSD